MPIVVVNGQQAETGCHLDGVRGWRALPAVALEIAPAFGYEVADLDHQYLEMYLDQETDDTWTVEEVVDGAVTWLNERTPEGWVWDWQDGDFGLWQVTEEGE
jgi:hypothetical protein